MKFEKKGLIYCPNDESNWAQQFAMVPTPLMLEEKLRIYLGFCTYENVGRIGYVDVDPDNPQKILRVSESPVLDIGIKGAFDDNGVVPVSILKEDGKIYLYYVGFQLGAKVPYYMFTGLAISEDGGDTFYRHSRVPVLDRNNEELYARCGANIIKDNGIFKAWYVGSINNGWTLVGRGDNAKLKPLYTMKYLESNDGIHWNEKIIPCMEFKNADEHGFGRPYVWKENGIYKMLSSIRTYSRGYYIGYAESVDGLKWQRKDEQAGIGLSEFGWDSQNLSYPYLYTYRNKTYLFYNGNGCGKSGFGYAEMIEP